MVDIYDPNYYYSFALDLTNKCNGKCQFCPRNNGFSKQIDPPGELDLNIFKKVFDKDYIKHVKNFVINGNLGEPILYSKLFDLLDYVRDNNPRAIIFISTNGSMRPTWWWKELAKRMSFQKHNMIRFCLDGLSDTHHLYRGTNYNIVLRNLITYIKAGGRADWQFIIFKHNQHQLEKAKKVAKEIGCSGFATVVSRHYNERLERPTIWDAKTKMERCAEECDAKTYCTPVENRHLYISHEGFLYPCCDFGLYKDFNVIEKYPKKIYIEYLRSLDAMNLAKSTLKEALNSRFFKYVIENNESLIRCVKSCKIQDNNNNEKILMRDVLNPMVNKDERVIPKNENIITNKVQARIKLRTKK